MILNCRYNMQFYLLTENFFGSLFKIAVIFISEKLLFVKNAKFLSDLTIFQHFVFIKTIVIKFKKVKIFCKNFLLKSRGF